MLKYTIYITHEGITYQTNVNAEKHKTAERVYHMAQEQVRKQWGN
jgi:hypothetical protein